MIKITVIFVALLLLVVVVIATAAFAKPLAGANKKKVVRDDPVFVVNCKPANAGGGGEVQAVLAQIRASDPTLPVTVQITGECFPPQNTGRPAGTVPVLELDPTLDSRPQSAQVSWIGQNQNALFVGGAQLLYTSWIPVTVNGVSALSMKLSSVGITSSAMVGGLQASTGLGECDQIRRMELFINGQPAIPARLPKGPAFGPFANMSNWCQIDKVINANTAFTTKCPALARLAGAVWPSSASVWAHGWWSFDWADSHVKVTNITSLGGGSYQLNIDPTTPPVYGFAPSARFYTSNSKRALSSPGEYFIDTSGSEPILYLIPPPQFGTYSNVWITVNTAPLLATTSTSRPITGHSFADIMFQYGQGNAVSLPNAANFSLQTITVSNFGSTCVSLHGLQGIEIINSNIANCGCKGLSISGGVADWKSGVVTPSNHGVTGNNIQCIGRVVRSYNPAISYAGVGITIAANMLQNGGHAAILGGGNSMTFASNKITNFLWGCRDCGAVYFGRSWTQLGTTLSGNVFQSLYKIEPTFLGSELVAAQYFDDQQSGVSVTASTCDNVESCFLVGGGRNIFIQQSTCTNTILCIHFDDRGLTWEQSLCNNSNTSTFAQQLNAANYQSPPFSSMYPYMVNVFEPASQPCTPFGNVIQFNTCMVNCTTFLSANKSTIIGWSSSNVIENNAHH